MSHDKIRAAARRRKAETGEPYAAARRNVLREHQAGRGGQPRPGPEWFPISYSKAGLKWITLRLDTLLGGGPGRSGVEVGPDEIRVRMAGFRFSVPRDSIRSVARSRARIRGASGVHANRGRLLVNGCADGLVELALDPPSGTGRTMNTAFINERVNTLILSLVDPDGFIAAVARDARPPEA